MTAIGIARRLHARHGSASLMLAQGRMERAARRLNAASQPASIDRWAIRFTRWQMVTTILTKGSLLNA